MFFLHAFFPFRLGWALGILDACIDSDVIPAIFFCMDSQFFSFLFFERGYLMGV